MVLTVNNPGPAPKITYAELPVATIGMAYSFSFAATGGTGALSWKIDGPLADPGLALSNSGALTATPSFANDCPGDYGGFQPPQYPVARFFIVQVTDAAGQSDAAPACMPAYYPQPTITSIYPSYAVPDGTAQTVTVAGTGFQPNSQLQANFSGQPTTFVSSSELQFVLYPSGNGPFQTAAGGQWAPGDYPIRVVAPYTYPGSTSAFAIDLPVPVISSSTASYLGTPNSPCFPNFSCELNLTGSGFGYFTQFQVVGNTQDISNLSTTSNTVPWTQVTTSSFFPASSGTYSLQVTNTEPARRRVCLGDGFLPGLRQIDDSSEPFGNY